MKCIIAGPRHITTYQYVLDAVEASKFTIDTVISGGARGIDRLGEKWSYEHDVNLQVFPANWALYGKSAGPIRNREMAEHADALIAVWDGKSRGTGNMIKEARKKELEVYIHHVDE